MQNNNFGILKRWFRLARPDKILFIIDILIILVSVICLIIAPIFAAKVIVNLTQEKYFIAILCLTYYYFFISSSRLVYIIKYRIYSKLVGSVYLPLQKRIFDQIINYEHTGVKKFSKEKMLHIYHDDALTISAFADTLTGSFSAVARIILTLGAVFYINKPVAILLLAINIINYFIYNKLAKKQAKANQATLDTIDSEFEAFSAALEACKVNKENEDDLRREFYARNEKFMKAKNSHSISNSAIENLYYAYYNIVIFLLTVLMIFFLSKEQINLTLYLIIIPYISSGIEVCNSLYNYITSLRSVDVAMNRLNILLNLK